MVDIHNLCSNPTPVYHIKMITHNDKAEPGSVRIGVDSAQPVLFHRIIHIPDNTYENKTGEKSFKKYLLLEPSLSQTYLSFDNFEPASGITSGPKTASDIKQSPEDLNIGLSDVTPVYGKKFKIRITSRHTGKKMDINLTFKLKKSNFTA